jgi:orotate phosphoribosyltransferase
MRVTATDEIAALVGLRCEPERVERVRTMIAASGMLLRGHFQLQSGVHSEYFIRVRGLAARQELLDAFVEELLRLISGHQSEVVLCPESAGFILGAAIARLASIDIAVVKADIDRRPSAELRTGTIKRDSVALLVNDVATSGSSLRLLHHAAQIHGATVRTALTLAAVGSESLRTANDVGVKGVWLIEGLWPVVPSDRCELCQRGIPLILSAELG